jgi:hypothetical protein
MVGYEALHSRASLVKTRKLRSPIPIGRGFLIFRGPVYGFENIGGFVLKVRLVRFQKIRKFCRGKWGWVYRPTLTSPHLTSPHLTSPHLTSPHLTSPHLISPHLISPHLTSPHLTSPHLTSPHLTSPHLTSPHLTSPHLTSPAPPAVFYAIWDKLTGDQRRAAHSFKAEK